MACVENIPARNADSEMEEGEIVDEADDLSDISSEEEFLLRQRLQVLENYNNVLERKKAKRSSIGSGRTEDPLLQDLSEISDLEETVPRLTSKANIIVYREQKPLKSYKHKKRKELKDSYREASRNKEHKKKVHRKKKLEVKIVSESSDESDDEYRNKRRKLANAVVVSKVKNDTSSLQARLKKMLCRTIVTETFQNIMTEDKETETDNFIKLEDVSCSPVLSSPINVLQPIIEIQSDTHIPNMAESKENVVIDAIDLCTDDEVKIITNTEISSISSTNEKRTDKNSEDNIAKREETLKKDSDKDSDEDLEQLRQQALQTKISKAKVDHLPIPPPLPVENKQGTLSDDEDSDTAELRLICLKSALLKKAMEMKRKQKLQKRLSVSSNLQDELLRDQEEFLNKIESENNNTDMESVDMDIGSDLEERGKELSIESVKNNITNKEGNKESVTNKGIPELIPEDDELEEDEDLLRAKLLTSLSKNLPNLVDPNILKTIDEIKIPENSAPAGKVVPEEKRIVINVGGSDSEGEHEATKNLTKMHIKLSEQIDFQQKLDIFLKSTRKQVENTETPDVIKETPKQKPQKFVAKAVNHLPKSEQAEYKNLVKRMAELEKIKQARQNSMNLINKLPIKETLKPRNVSIDATKLITINGLDEQISMSRKRIAEESAKMLNLKQEGTKLSQKYKIVATELKNTATAITLNKKEQRSVQIKLSKIRLHHQRLLNSSNSKHSKGNTFMSTTKLQKENDPSKEEHLKPRIAPEVKSMTVSVVNDLIEDRIPSSKLSVQIDVSNNKKTVKIPNELLNLDANTYSKENVTENQSSLPEIRNNDYIEHIRHKGGSEFDDYKSPLLALDTATWEGDPNAILCPFDVGGNCKDPDCKYLHPKIPSQP